MTKFIIAAAVAVLAAAPASATEIRVAVAGKSADQLNAAIAGAARSVCLKETAGETLRLGAYQRCFEATVKAAQGKLRA